MLSLNLPVFDTKINVRNGKCNFRRDSQTICRTYPGRMGTATLCSLSYCAQRISERTPANEVMVKLNGTTKRCDTVLTGETFQHE